MSVCAFYNLISSLLRSLFLFSQFSDGMSSNNDISGIYEEFSSYTQYNHNKLNYWKKDIHAYYNSPLDSK